MKRHTVLSVLSGTFAIALAVTPVATASAYPIRDVNPPCPSTSVRTTVAAVTTHYARYFEPADISTGDANANGYLCVVALKSAGPQVVGLAGAPIMFVDDSGA